MTLYSKKKFKSKAKIKIPKPYICKLCNKELKSIPGLASHLKNQHNGLSYGEYLEKYLNIDVVKINAEWEAGRKERKNKQLKGLRQRHEFIKGKNIKERMSSIEYIAFRKNMKGIFTLDWYIKKYGITEGKIKYKERNLNLSKNTFWHKFNKENKENWSASSQELFWELYKMIKDQYKKIYFGELNHEFGCQTPFNFDFVILDTKKIIEFNGDKFHANPKIYNEKDIPLSFLNKNAKEIWEADSKKNNMAIDKGYDIKIIWETDYYKDKNKIILECFDFILK